MSKKQQYTTKFYEDNGDGIQAVTRDESGKVVNVLGGFEADPGTGLSVLAAARENWPYADPFESYQWDGKTIESWDNQEWIEDQVGAENLVEHTVSLTTVDGQNDYGELTCKVRPITFDEARQYNNLIASSDNDSRIEGYWTCTAWSVPRRTGEYRGDFVASVTYNGMIGESNSWDCYDVRLVCILKSDINVRID